MSKISLYNTEGGKSGDIELNPNIFDIEMKTGVVHRVVETIMGNTRKNIASTKDRSEVRGGGKKPWKQKGTGRARAGSNRSPIWIGGGITFGPSTDRNYKRKINKKERRKALFMTLSDKAREKKIFVIDGLKIDKLKTKKASEIIKKLHIENGKILLAIPKKDEKISKSFRNIKGLNIVIAENLNAYEVIKHENLMMPKESVEIIEKTFLK